MTSREGRLSFFILSVTPWVFQLTTSRGGRRISGLNFDFFWFFNSRPLVEVDLPNFYLAEKKVLFNSRPLVEVDWYNRYNDCSDNFSTHDLSWRSTYIDYNYFILSGFSTHDLSWRSTLALLITPNELDFSTHDLSWRSTVCRLLRFPGAGFSTHDLSWRSTA